MNKAVIAHEARRQSLLKLLKPDPVRLHHEPRWLLRLVDAAIRDRGSYPSRAFGLWGKILNLGIHPHFLDHWGSIKNGTEFVSEPYLRDDQLRAAMQFADAVGLQLHISAVSEWNPPSTVRLIFSVPEPISPPLPKQATQPSESPLSRPTDSPPSPAPRR